ncbi:hypothetical protein HBH69_109510 [Parastagonospora nodorum]|nr:hypothetical protein HBH69_109510 [Parastagonospora nodorum]KAH5249571.1 hypothetical protein HBI71_166870 [Parastagonospora nodorum]KAH5647461.1 hypothetical protein HBI23_179760 [Parastagonospora nodorum]KAH6046276.1 hypothetical protein HBI54_085620 [Parastagonospora nodorum]
MASFNNRWIWSNEHQKYYYSSVDVNGQVKYTWSGPAIEHFEDRRTQAKPGTGRTEELDAAYRVRARAEEFQFFKPGRVFAMLWSETAGTGGFSTTPLVPGRFGQLIYSQIRTFVVVAVRHTSHFVEACCIHTYGGRGTMKPGCNPVEHTAMYLTGTEPNITPAELERGMNKEPIEVVPVDKTQKLAPMARVRLGKIYSIETNVKVKDVGLVRDDHLTKLMDYWRYEMGYDSHLGGSWRQAEHHLRYIGYDRPASQTSLPGSNDIVEQVEQPSIDHDIRVDDYENRLRGGLHQDFEVIGNPRGFYKKGRVVMVPWPELGGPWVKDPLGLSGVHESPVKIKIRRFVVIRPKASFCLCLSINTYGGQATTKAGVAIQDHAAVVVEGGEEVLHDGEAKLLNSAIFIRVENEAAPPVDPMSRINFAKVYTLEYNVKVRNVGRIIPDSIWRMDEYFVQSTRT